MNRAILIFVVIVGAALPLGVWGSYRRMHPDISTPPPAREPQIEVVEREPAPTTPALIPTTQVQPTTARPVPPAPKPVAVAPASPMPLNPERPPVARPKPPNLPMITVKAVAPPKTIRAKTVISVSDPTPVAKKTAVKKPVSRKPSSTRRRHRRR